MAKKRKSQLPPLPSSGSPTKRSRVAALPTTLSNAVVIEDVRRKPKRSTAPVGRMYTHVPAEAAYRRPTRWIPISQPAGNLFPVPPVANTSSVHEHDDDPFAGVVIEHEVMPERTRKVRITTLSFFSLI